MSVRPYLFKQIINVEVKKDDLKTVDWTALSSPNWCVKGLTNDFVLFSIIVRRSDDGTRFDSFLRGSPYHSGKYAIEGRFSYDGTTYKKFSECFEPTELPLRHPVMYDDIGESATFRYEVCFYLWKNPRAPPPTYVHDMQLLVDDSAVNTNRQLLGMHSPVFKGILKKTGNRQPNARIQINGFSEKTVQQMTEFIQGRNVIFENVMEALNFAVKYEIDSLVTHIFKNHLSRKVFVDIVPIAWSLQSQQLKRFCADFFRKNILVCFQPGFKHLEMSIRDELTRMAFDIPLKLRF